MAVSLSIIDIKARENQHKRQTVQERRQMLRKAGKLCADALRRPCAGAEHARRGALPPVLRVVVLLRSALRGESLRGAARGGVGAVGEGLRGSACGVGGHGCAGVS